MPITFHTQSHADLTFLTDIGKALIEMMGHTPNVPGAILADDIPAALTRLRAALALSDTETDNTSAPNDEEEPPIPLARRALPLVALLESARAAQQNVMWD